MKKVDTSDFWMYCEKYVKKRKVWGKVLKTDLIMTYAKSISGPILKLPKEMSTMAKQNFKRVVYIINNKLSKQAAINLIKRMIKMGVKNSAEMRDEYFF
jgi:phage terminase small subunit